MALRVIARLVTELGPLFLSSMGYSEHLNRKLPEVCSLINIHLQLLE
jgi:hypothetical protein